MPAFCVGDPANQKTAIGPMVTQKQCERVQSYIRKGIEEGAEVLVGGEDYPEGYETGYFVKPTVFVNVTNDMTIAQAAAVTEFPSMAVANLGRTAQPTVRSDAIANAELSTSKFSCTYPLCNFFP
jgi:hypothetical protein